ncbi:MAG: type I DNA topoisomerase, partial [Parcubacteria group bacterium]|nr:type I DNA topoisomerase [Parcubacteria group bacterium]
MNLIIVESPTKAKTIGKFVGKGYEVESSYGHIRDLPKSKFGIDVEHNFAPQYVIPTKSRKTVNQLKKKAASAKMVILATDEDREGEAIAWHLAQALDLQPDKTERIAFHEITDKALRESLKHPRLIDLHLVDAQQARRVLDRIVGYELSPFLWKKIRSGLSAGRVQSVALRMIVDREREIQNFKPEEYWTIAARLATSDKRQETSFEANLVKIGDKTLEKFDIKTKSEAEKIVRDLEQSSFKVSGVERKETKRNPLPPFTTSTLQQTASLRYGLSTKQTMMFAQWLYENGYITYMRTDSLNLSEESLAAASNFIEKKFGKNYAELRRFKTKSKLAQEAHEAIRPTDPSLAPEMMKKKIEVQHQKLYQLIWSRFIASQMSPAVFDATSIKVAAKSKKENYSLRANGSVLKFDAFLKVYPIKYKEAELPELKEGEILEPRAITPAQHFTEPPPRYNEATIIKTLEENGIGRPST